MVQKRTQAPAGCPPWCVETHTTADREDAAIHIGEPVHLGDGITARLCMSVNALGVVEDGPYVLVGEEEYTLDEATALGTALIAMARQGGRTPSRVKSGRRQL